jgi:Pyridoxamine 5'-phosphate oxidase
LYAGRPFREYDRTVSTRVGDHLDEALFRRLSGEPSAIQRREAILIATADERGRPHPALLAHGEVVAVTPALVRLAVSAGSATARNLAARGALTLCLVDADGVAYVKAAARALPAEPLLAGAGLVAFEARVEDVLADAPLATERARLTSGITFATDDPAFSRDWASRIEALRRA